MLEGSVSCEMPAVIRREMVEALEAWGWNVFPIHQRQEFYTCFIEEQGSNTYLDDRRAEIKSLAGLKPSSPKAPVQQ